MMCDGAFLAVLAWYDHQEGFAPDVDLKTQIRNRKSLTREMPAVLAEFLADFDSLDPRGTGLVPLSKLAKLGFVKQHMQLPPGSGSVKMTDLLRIHLRNETKSVELMELFSHFDLVRNPSFDILLFSIVNRFSILAGGSRAPQSRFLSRQSRGPPKSFCVVC
jgi:hypothetical protein